MSRRNLKLSTRDRGFSTRDRGFSLVELMISLALFGLIASGAMSLVMSGARTQAHSARVDVAQSGLRAGLDYMTRDILSASAGAKTGALMVAATGAVVQPITVIDGGASGPDSIEIYTIDATYMGTVSDALGVAPGASSISIILNDANYPFVAGDLVQLSELNSATLVKLTGATATTLTGAVTNTPGGVTYSRPASFVFKTRHVKYSIANAYGNAGQGNGLVLMMDLYDGANGASNQQPLAEGVEDLQIALGVDSNADGLIGAENAGTANGDEWVFNNAGDTAPVTVANLKSVRVTLVAKSTGAERGTFPLRPAAEDHTGGTVADGYFRRTIRSEVAVRNFNL
jgi:prepilin-type N-terminal cleavage/methylation domain-containing protein